MSCRSRSRSPPPAPRTPRARSRRYGRPRGRCHHPRDALRRQGHSRGPHPRGVRRPVHGHGPRRARTVRFDRSPPAAHLDRRTPPRSPPRSNRPSVQRVGRELAVGHRGRRTAAVVLPAPRPAQGARHERSPPHPRPARHGGCLGRRGLHLPVGDRTDVVDLRGRQHRPTPHLPGPVHPLGVGGGRRRARGARRFHRDRRRPTRRGTRHDPRRRARQGPGQPRRDRPARRRELRVRRPAGAAELAGEAGRGRRRSGHRQGHRRTPVRGLPVARQTDPLGHRPAHRRPLRPRQPAGPDAARGFPDPADRVGLPHVVAARPGFVLRPPDTAWRVGPDVPAAPRAVLGGDRRTRLFRTAVGDSTGRVHRRGRGAGRDRAPPGSRTYAK